MKRARIVQCLCVLAVLLVMPVLLPGCAKTPSGASVADLREMTFRITCNGPINENYYYFTAIDTTGGGEGPTPVFPGLIAMDGWVTGSANYYVQYHQRQYTLYRITSLQPFRSEPIGAPLRSTLPDAGGSVLAFTIDLNTIHADGDSVDVNIITTDQPLTVPRLIDGLGLDGTQFLGEVSIETDRTITNTSEGPAVEGADDVLDQNRDPQTTTDQTRPLDIIDWSITTNI